MLYVITKNKLLLRSNKRATFYAFLRERDLLLMTTYKCSLKCI